MLGGAGGGRSATFVDPRSTCTSTCCCVMYPPCDPGPTTRLSTAINAALAISTVRLWPLPV